MSHEASEQLKDTALALFGVMNAVLPSWVKLIPEAFPIMEGGLRILVGFGTVGFLWHRSMYYRKRTKLLNKDNNKDSDE